MYDKHAINNSKNVHVLIHVNTCQYNCSTRTPRQTILDDHGIIHLIPIMLRVRFFPVTISCCCAMESPPSPPPWSCSASLWHAPAVNEPPNYMCAVCEHVLPVVPVWSSQLRTIGFDVSGFLTSLAWICL